MLAFRSTWVALVASLLGAGCTMITEFDRSQVVEDNPRRCSDATDNDGNGLTDCQDFGCLGQDVCCTIPTLAIVDSFDGQECASESCDAPDPDCSAIDEARWQPWGVPYPIVCEGSLSPNKTQQCYDVGVLSREGLALRPGLRVETGIVGRPEIMGRLEVGLTFQDEVRSSLDPCEPIDVVEPVISLKQLADGDGYRVVATFDQREVGVSSLVTDQQRHLVTLAVEDDRRVHYGLDGEEFAQSPEEQPIPESEPVAHLSLAGRGQSARFDDVSVTAGTQCDAPAAWQAMDPFVALDANPDGAAWDSFSVFAPGVTRTPGGVLRMFYTGCAERLSECDPMRTGVGRADADADYQFVRMDDCSAMGAIYDLCSDGLENPFASSFNNAIEVAPSEVGGAMLGYASLLSDGDEIQTVTLFGDEVAGIRVVGEPTDRIRVGPVGAWDGYEVCCASAVAQDDQVMVWYAGRDSAHSPWRIGLATSDAGVHLTKYAGNPVFTEGAAGTFDDNGVGAPSVVYDPDRDLYRMWYEARGFLGVTSIGYAISLDGIDWHRYPGNPVVAPEAFGLVSVGSPTVVVEGGRKLMWLQGRAADAVGSRIYGLVNLGDQVAEEAQ